MYSAFMDHREVLLIGGTGFIGRYVGLALSARGMTPRLLVRDGSQGRIPEDLRKVARLTPGDVADPEWVENAARGTEAVVNLAGIFREDSATGATYEWVHVAATRHAVRAARAWGIRRFVQVSALGADPRSPSALLASKGRAEEIVRSSGLDWTVVRPPLVFGPGDRFLEPLAATILRAPVVPVPADRLAMVQPVHVRDLADGIAAILGQGTAIGRAFDAAGPETLFLDDLVDRVASAAGRRVRKVHLPLAMVRRAVATLSRRPWFPLSADMLDLLVREKVHDGSPFYEAAGIVPRRIGEHLAVRKGGAWAGEGAGSMGRSDEERDDREVA